MSDRTQQVGIAPANLIHANNYSHTFERADWPIVPEVAAKGQGAPVRAQMLRIPFAFFRSVIWKFKFLRDECVQSNGLAPMGFSTRGTK